MLKVQRKKEIYDALKMLKMLCVLAVKGFFSTL